MASSLLRNKPFLVTMGVALIFIAFAVYLFVPIGTLHFLPQEESPAGTDIQGALTLVAELWHVPATGLHVFSVRESSYGDKTIVIIEPKALSSAHIWIASPLRTPGQPTSGYALHERIHLLNNYTPQGPLEGAIARNFYTRGGWAKAHEAVVVNIEAAIPFGKVVTNSKVGELQIPTVLSYPLFFMATHSDFL